MILGIGTDIVDIRRMEKVYARHGDRLLLRILTAEERQQCHPNEQVTFLAKRFAAKEAFSKALGSGIASTMNWQGVSILRGSKGAPECVVHSEALQHSLEKRGILRTHVSLSDEKTYAIAMIIFESA